MRRFSQQIMAILLVLVFGFFLPTDLLPKKRTKGAVVVVEKSDAVKVKGELLKVTGNSLVLMEGTSTAGVTIPIDDIRTVKVIRKSKFWKGFLVGYGLVAPHAFVGARHFLKEEGDNYGIVNTFILGTLLSGILAGGPALVGGLTGAAAGKDKTVRIDGKSKPELDSVLSELDSLARFKNPPPLSAQHKKINIIGALGFNAWDVRGLSFDIGVEHQLSGNVFGQFLFDYYLAPKVSDYSTIDESSGYGFNLNIVYKLVRLKKLNFFIKGGIHFTTSDYTATTTYQHLQYSESNRSFGIGTGIGVEGNLGKKLSLIMGITGKSAITGREQYWLKCYAGLSLHLN